MEFNFWLRFYLTAVICEKSISNGASKRSKLISLFFDEYLKIISQLAEQARQHIYFVQIVCLYHRKMPRMGSKFLQRIQRTTWRLLLTLSIACVLNCKYLCTIFDLLDMQSIPRTPRNSMIN